MCVCASLVSRVTFRKVYETKVFTEDCEYLRLVLVVGLHIIYKNIFNFKTLNEHVFKKNQFFKPNRIFD